MMQNTSPALKKALQAVKLLLSQSIQDNTLKLPPVAAMAEQAQVALTTMSKAVKYYKHIGAISCIPGHGIYANLPPENGYSDRAETAIPVSGTYPAHHLWQRIKQDLEAKILNGVIPPGQPLPSYKELQSTYSTSFATLKKALAGLAADGVITPFKRGYMVPSIGRDTAISGSFVLVEPGYDFGKMTLAEGLDEEIFQLLEKECAKQNIRLDIIGLHREAGEVIPIDVASDNETSIRDKEDILGYIYKAKIDFQPFHQIIPTLFHFRKPLAVLDMLGNFEIGSTILNAPYFQRFAVSVSPHPAQIVARYLLEQHHQKIAYISPFHRMQWSKTRLDGLTGIFNAAGHENGVVPLVFDKFRRGLEFEENARQKRNLNYPLVTDADTAQMPYPFNDQLGSALQQFQRVALIRGELYSQCLPLFDSALADKSITAWVCANDWIAMFALDYLRKKRIAVPDEISLLSFDDSVIALRERITSYSFNIQALVNEMLSFILRPLSSIPGKRGKVITIKGTIVQRKTTARNQPYT
ncbi:MAG: GntR family transcriptional regulator [Chitinivibrionales bacterium]|nr:GntR family transcriptional regulator [Chitinivibrionales bacterium]